MNVYLIYKFQEYELFRKDFESLVKSNDHDEVFFFKQGENDRWKERARSKFEIADVVVYARSQDSHYDEKDMANVSFELELAQSLKKPILVYEKSKGIASAAELKGEYTPTFIYEESFPGDRQIRFRTISELNMTSIKRASFDMGDSLFACCEAPIDNVVLLEEYKIMLSTSEKMADRRQETNKFYIALCSAMITAMAAFLAAGIEMWMWGLIVAVLSIPMVILCGNWRKTLESYGKSNEAKYEVLNEIEKKLPASIFTNEWRYGKTIDYQSYSEREKIIPQVFRWFFLAVVIVGACLGAYTLGACVLGFPL